MLRIGAVVIHVNDARRASQFDGTYLDLYTDSAEQRAEVERLISLGATPVDWTYPEDARWVVLADPEGNHFCVVNTGR